MLEPARSITDLHAAGKVHGNTIFDPNLHHSRKFGIRRGKGACDTHPAVRVRRKLVRDIDKHIGFHQGLIPLKVHHKV